MNSNCRLFFFSIFLWKKKIFLTKIFKAVFPQLLCNTPAAAVGECAKEILTVPRTDIELGNTSPSVDQSTGTYISAAVRQKGPVKNLLTSWARAAKTQAATAAVKVKRPSNCHIPNDAKSFFRICPIIP